ncbi:hypothetical protein SLS62_009268 [Diatrype stigma]|uniref:Uncharacterized protein n=1 Tax=Diatrype stigma TaxID=117547 RepID=A0AAN9UFR0_9PEZI
MGRPGPDVVEREGLLTRDPESMADHPGGDEESAIPAWRRRVRRQLPPWLNYKIVLLSLALMGISVGFLANAFRGVRGGQEAPPAPQNPAQPISEPVAGSPSDPAWVSFEPGVCKDAGFRWQDAVLPLVFSEDRNVAFVEELDEQRTTGAPVRVAGYVQVLQVAEGDDPRILLEIASNDEDIPIDVLTDESSQAMRVRVPSKFDSSRYREPCVEMRATIFVPRDGDIGGFTVGTVHLDISLIESLSLRVSDFSKISSVVGDISSASSYPPPYGERRTASAKSTDLTFVPARDSYNFHSRVIEVSTTTGKIHGNWPLFDMLGLHTTSGDITASITPKDALASDPKPAVLSISSVSGGIQAAEPVHGEEPLPRRDYLVDVKSISGVLRCSLAAGAGTHLKSTSSDITVDLQPVFNKDKVTRDQPAQLETITTSGLTTVRILEPLWFEGDQSSSTKPATASGSGTLDRLEATHKSSSGNIRLRYPQSWEGNLFAESMSGSMGIKGKDVRVVRRSTGWPRSMHARKGDDSKDASLIRVHSLSGDLDAVIGDV